MSAAPPAPPPIAPPAAPRAGWRRLLPRGAFARSAALLVGSTALGQALVVLVSPLLTRLYNPSEMGLLAVYMAFLTLLLAVSSLKYEQAIPLPADDRDALQLLVLSLGLLLATVALVAGAILLAARPLCRLLGAPGLAPYLWLLPLGLLGAGVYQVFAAWAVRDRNYRELASTSLLHGVVQTTVQLGLGFAGLGAGGLMAGDAAGRASGSTRLARSAWRRLKGGTARPRLAELRRIAHRYRDFPRYTSTSGLLNTLGLQLPALLFVALYGPAVAGALALGQRVMGIPTRVVGVALAQVYLGEAAGLARENPAALESLFNRLTRKLLVSLGLPMLAGALLAPLLFPFVFGREWAEAGTYLLLLAPSSIAQLIATPVAQSAMVVERQGAQLAVDALRTVLVAAGIAVPHLLGAPARVAVLSYSACLLASYLAYYLVFRHTLRSAARQGPGALADELEQRGSAPQAEAYAS